MPGPSSLGIWAEDIDHRDPYGAEANWLGGAVVGAQPGATLAT